MSKRGKGVLLGDKKTSIITGYLVIGRHHYEIYGTKVSDLRTNLHVRRTDDDGQEDLFDDRPGEASAQ